MDANDRAIVGFVMVGHAMVHVFEMAIPIFLTVWLARFSTTAAVLGTVVAIGYALFGVGALPGGLLVDRFGAKPLICACLGGMGLSFVAVALAPGVLAIALALGLWGLSASVYHPAGLTLVSNGVSERGAGFAYHGMAGNAGIAGGPLATVLLLLAIDWRVVAALLAVPALLAAVIGTRVRFDSTAALDETAGARSTPSSLAGFLSETRQLFTMGFVLVFAIVVFNGLYYRGILTFLPDLLGDLVTDALGQVRLEVFAGNARVAEQFDIARYVFVGLLVVGIGGQYVGGRLTDRIVPEQGLVGVLIALTALAVAFVPVARTGIVGTLVVAALLGFFLFAMQPLSQATIAKYSAPGSRGLSFGYTYLGIFGVGAIGSAVSGTVLTYFSPPVMFLVLAGFAAVGGLLALALVRGNQDATTVRPTGS